MAVPASELTDQTVARWKSRSLRPEIDKLRFEGLKAELEISEIRSWWRRPAVLQSYAAIVVAVLTALIGWANGWFSVKAEALAIQRQKFKTTSGRSMRVRAACISDSR